MRNPIQFTLVMFCLLIVGCESIPGLSVPLHRVVGNVAPNHRFASYHDNGASLVFQGNDRRLLRGVNIEYLGKNGKILNQRRTCIRLPQKSGGGILYMSSVRKQHITREELAMYRDPVQREERLKKIVPIWDYDPIELLQGRLVRGHFATGYMSSHQLPCGTFRVFFFSSADNYHKFQGTLKSDGSYGKITDETMVVYQKNMAAAIEKWRQLCDPVTGWKNPDPAPTPLTIDGRVIKGQK